MNNIGIIAGGGDLPIAIAKNLIKKKYKIIFLLLKIFIMLKFIKNLT